MVRQILSSKIYNMTSLNDLLQRRMLYFKIMFFFFSVFDAILAYLIAGSNLNLFVSTLIYVPIIFAQFFVLTIHMNKLKNEIDKEIIRPMINLKESMKKVSFLNEHTEDENTMVFADDTDNIDINTIEIFEVMESYKRLSIRFFEALQEREADHQQLQALYHETSLLYKSFQDTYLNFAKKLSLIAEAFDEQTGNHVERVGELAAFIAEKMGINEYQVDLIRNFAPLHDIGKILIPKEILSKPGALSREEFEIVKKHTIFGAKLIGEDPLFEMAKKIALLHHEKYDGSGYPFGLKGDQIPIEAQIVSVVDVYDALRSERPYKKALSHEETIEVLLGHDGKTSFTQFNPKILAILVKYSDEIKALWENLSSSNRKIDSLDFEIFGKMNNKI